jgi:hypothetical protein
MLAVDETMTYDFGRLEFVVVAFAALIIFDAVLDKWRKRNDG